MTRAVIQFVAQDKRGDIVPGAAVEIRDATTGALVQVWNSRTGGSLIGNPGATDSGGQFKGYINPARVNVHVEKGSFSRTWSDVAADDSIIVASNITLRVPSDYPTLQAAVDAASDYRTSRGAIVTVLIESGHKLTTGIYVSRGDYRHITISSEDSTVKLADSFVPVADPASGSADYSGTVFGAREAVFPKLSTVIDLEGKPYNGLVLSVESVATILSNCGVINAGKYGLVVTDQSSCVSPFGKFTGCGYGIRITAHSFFYAPGIDISGTNGGASTAGDGNPIAALTVSRASYASIMSPNSGNGANLTGSSNRGILAVRSYVNATYADVSEAAGNGIHCDHGAVVNFYAGTADNCGAIGIFCTEGTVFMGALCAARGCVGNNVQIQRGCHFSASEADFSGGGNHGITITDSFASIRSVNASNAASVGILAESSIVNANGAKANDCATGVNVTASTVSAPNLEAKDCTSRGINATQNSVVNANGADITGAGVDGVRADRSSVVNCYQANASNAAAAGFIALNGASICATSGTASGCATGVQADDGGKIVFASGTATGCTSLAASADDMSDIDANDADLSGCTGTYGVRARRGSRLNLHNANCQKGVSPDATDIRIETGSWINASSATGGTSETVNTLTANGIIFQ